MLKEAIGVQLSLRVWTLAKQCWISMLQKKLMTPSDINLRDHRPSVFIKVAWHRESR